MKRERVNRESVLNKNSVSLAGEFAVLSQLALRGYDANMTLGHTKGVDILVSDPASRNMYQLEVKTCIRRLSDRPIQTRLFGKLVAQWIMSSKHEQIRHPTLFYCFVLIDERTLAFRYFVVPSEQVAAHVKDTHKRWLKKDSAHNDSDVRLFRIGLSGEKYVIPTPTDIYEDNWSFNVFQANS